MHVYWRWRSSLNQTGPRYPLHSCLRWPHRACRIATHCSLLRDDAVITAKRCHAAEWPIDSDDDDETWIHLLALRSCVETCSYYRISIDCGCRAMLAASITRAACCPTHSVKFTAATAAAADSRKPIMQPPPVVTVAAIGVAGLVGHSWSTFLPAPRAASPQWFTCAWMMTRDERG